MKREIRHDDDAKKKRGSSASPILVGKGNFDELSKVGWTTTHVSVRGKVFLFTGSKSRECFGFIFSRFSGHFARFLRRDVQD